MEACGTQEESIKSFPNRSVKITCLYLQLVGKWLAYGQAGLKLEFSQNCQ